MLLTGKHDSVGCRGRAQVRSKHETEHCSARPLAGVALIFHIKLVQVCGLEASRPSNIGSHIPGPTYDDL
jgi:hypothetical protein